MLKPCLNLLFPFNQVEKRSPWYFFYIANILVQKEDFKGAIEILDYAISLIPDNAIYFNLRGVCKFKQGMYEQAARDFLSALDLDRSSAMDLANVGMCYKMMGKKRAGYFIFKGCIGD